MLGGRGGRRKRGREGNQIVLLVAKSEFNLGVSCRVSWGANSQPEVIPAAVFSPQGRANLKV